MQNSKRFTIFLLIIGLNWINAQRATEHDIDSITIAINRGIKSAVPHTSDYYQARIWNIQYRNGKFNRIVARSRAERKRVRKLIKKYKYVRFSSDASTSKSKEIR